MMYSNLRKTLLQVVTGVALLLCLNAAQAQVTAYDESVDGDLGGILTILNPDPVTLPSPSASNLVFDVKGSLSATDLNDFFKFTVPAGFRLESIQMVQLTRTFGLAFTNVDVFFYDKNNAFPLPSFVASLLNLTTGSSANLISSLSPPLDAGTYTVRVDRDGGSWNYCLRITLSCKLSLQCPSDATVNTSNNGKGDCTASYAWTHPNIVGCPGGSSVILQVSVAGNPFTPVTPGGAASATFGPTGKYEVKYTATDGVNTETCSFFVTVKDDEEPIITTTPGALDRKLSCDDAAGIANAQSLQPSATDNCTASNDLKITPASSIKPGNCPNNYVIERTFQFEDEAGNKSAIYTQIITVEDKEAPVFGQTIPTRVDVLTSQGASCPATPDISLTDNFQLIATGQTTTYSIHGIPFTTPNANASDNCTPSNQIRLFARGRKISRTNGAQGQCTSIYQVDFRLVDECGNTSTASIQYIVKDDSAPVFNVHPQNQSVNVNSFRDIEGLLLNWVQSAGGAQISDNCTSVSVSSKIIGSNVTGNTYCYTYEFTARDLCQNTTADTATFCATVVANAARQQSIVSGTMKTPAVDAPVEVKLYPNPAQHEVNIDLSAFLGRAVNIRIVNTLGQAMQEIRFAEVQAPTERIVLAGYRSGLYLVTIQSADGSIITQKLQIEQR